MIDEGSVVADEQERARPVDQIRLEQLERLEIEIVRGLVQDEHVRRARKQPREQKTIPFSS